MAGRRTSKSVVLVYTFGVGGKLVEGEERVFGTMALAHTYKNKLIEIERARRQGIRDVQRSLEVLTPLHEAVDVAKKRVDDLYAALRANHADQRTRRVSQAQKDQIAEAKLELKTHIETLKIAKTAAQAELAPKYTIVEETAQRAIREARGVSQVYHPTYQLAEAAAKASRNKLSKHLAPEDDPRFRRFPRPYGGRTEEIAEGRIGIVTGGKRVTVAEAFSGENDWLRIARIDPAAYSMPCGERKRRTRARVSFRVGSNPDRTPIWATFSDVQIHRQLPADGVITLAWVKLTMRGDRPTDRHWDIQLTIEAPSTDNAVTQVVHARPSSIAAINIGWRALETGERRVAYVVDDEGDEREITYAAKARIPRRICGRSRGRGKHFKPPQIEGFGDRFVKADSVRGIRGRAFDQARDFLLGYLTGLPSCPPLFEPIAATLGQWRSSSRLSKLVQTWRKERHPNDETAFDRMWQWVQQDSHLYNWETNERSRAEGARKAHYREVARQLCRAYETIVLGEMDLRKFAAKKKPEDAEDDATRDQRRGRARAAPSEFIAALTLFARKFGTRIVKESAIDITRNCHIHGGTDEWDARTTIEHQWRTCGCIHDQDANACHNLLKRFRERSGDDETPEVARDPELASDSSTLTSPI